MGAFDAAALLLYFVAIRETGVAIATFFLFMQPVWVALLAPRLLGSATERVVYVAIGLAFGGLVIILVPALLGDGVHVSVLGLAGRPRQRPLPTPASPWSSKGLSRRLESVTMVLAECTLDTLFLLPLALWQTLGDRLLRSRAAICWSRSSWGCWCTAVGYTLWMEGMRWVRVQHSAVLGFLTPVAAPIYALVLLGQPITGWTVAGGALILAAGILVVLRGQ